MKNFISSGDTLTVPAPTGGITSGAGVLAGSLFGVAATTQAEGDDVEVKTTGVYTLPKTSAQAWTVGQRIYWDNTNKVATSTASSNKLIGVATAIAANLSDEGEVRLSGAFTL